MFRDVFVTEMKEVQGLWQQLKWIRKRVLERWYNKPCYAHALDMLAYRLVSAYVFAFNKISLGAQLKACVCCSETLLLAWRGSEWMLDACAHFILIIPQMSSLEIDWAFWEACQLGSPELCWSLFVWQLKQNKHWKHCFIKCYANATSERLFLWCLLSLWIMLMPNKHYIHIDHLRQLFSSSCDLFCLLCFAFFLLRITTSMVWWVPFSSKDKMVVWK